MNVDREEASEQGLTERDVANDALVSLSSSGQVAPNFWLDTSKGRPVPRRGADAPIQGRLVRRRPADARARAGGKGAEMLGNLTTLERDITPVNVTHYNVLSTFDVQANVQGSDLGSCPTPSIG
jgi:multidrug efflux pump subunit AcrB